VQTDETKHSEVPGRGKTLKLKDFGPGNKCSKVFVPSEVGGISEKKEVERYRGGLLSHWLGERD